MKGAWLKMTKLIIRKYSRKQLLFNLRANKEKLKWKNIAKKIVK